MYVKLEVSLKIAIKEVSTIFWNLHSDIGF